MEKREQINKFGNNFLEKQLLKNNYNFMFQYR